MTICKLCCDVDVMRGRDVKILMKTFDNGAHLWTAYCEDCGAVTSLCATVEEASARMEMGWVIRGEDA